MTDVQEKPTLVFDDNTYVIEDLSERAQYIVRQLQTISNEQQIARDALDRLEVARGGFVTLLREELEEEPAEAEVVEEELSLIHI